MTLDSTAHDLSEPGQNRDAVEVIGDTWPAPPEAEAAYAWRIPWPLAPLAIPFAIFFPRRWGPSLAVSSWLAAFFVHVVSIVWTFGSMFAFGYEHQFMSNYEATWTFNLMDELRKPFAGFGLGMYEQLSSPGDWAAAIAFGGFLEVLFWIGPLGLLPLFTVGESRRALYLRCVKLTYWSTMCAIPFGWVLPRSIALVERSAMGFSDYWPALLLLPWLIWWFSVLVRLGGRVAIPPKLEPRPPQCDRCGYRLTGTRYDGRCAECGLEVARSVPEARRPSPFAQRAGLYLSTLVASWRARPFGRAIAIYVNHRAARNFAFLTLLLVGLIVGLFGSPFFIADEYEVSRWGAGWAGYPVLLGRLAAALISVVLGGCWLLLVGAVGCWFGFAQAQRRVAAVCYGAGWLVICAILWVAGDWFAFFVDASNLGRGVLTLPLVRERISMAAILILVGLVPFLASLLLSPLHVRRLLSETRYANM